MATNTKKNRMATALIGMVAVVATLLTASVAEAAVTHELPFKCGVGGTQWDYSTYRTYKTHVHGEAVDLNLPNDADNGKQVIPSAPGTISAINTYNGQVTVNHGSAADQTLYAHLVLADGLRVGMGVSRGTVLGTVSSVGDAYGAHLHYGQYKNGALVTPTFHGAKVTYGPAYDAGDAKGIREGTKTLQSYNNCPPSPPSTPPAGHSHVGEILRNSDTGASCLFKSNSLCFPIPSGGDFLALQANGIKVHNLTSTDYGKVPKSSKKASVHTVDDPKLLGTPGYLNHERSNLGHGGDYVWTRTATPSAAADNCSAASLWQAPGFSRVKAYVPGNHATANVIYQVFDGKKLVAQPRINQANHHGWVTLTARTFTTNHVTVKVCDNKATAAWQYLAFDAIQIVPLR